MVGGRKNVDSAIHQTQVLRASLLDYVLRGLTQKEKLARLVNDHSLHIGTTKLNVLERKLGIPSVRRSAPSPEVSRQEVIDEVEKDVLQCNGPNYIKGKLKDRGIMVARDTVREIMHDHFPAEFDLRYPGRNRSQIPRQGLTALGPFHEVCSDGHEKLSKQALQMGDVGLSIYAWKDKWSGCLLKIVVIPDCRTAGAIGHLFLDFVDAIGGIPLQMTTDKGSEIGWQCTFQEVLRELCALNVDLTVYRPFAAIKSVHNTIIEAFWRWLRTKLGLNIKHYILQGKTQHIFDSVDRSHIQLFNWIFPPLVQKQLDEFQTWWNQHRIRTQPEKDMPSGHVPADAIEHPELLGGLSCHIPVPKHIVQDLRDILTEEVGPYNQFLQWVDDDFADAAEQVYQELGRPEITLATAWNVFHDMAPAFVHS